MPVLPSFPIAAAGPPRSSLSDRRGSGPSVHPSRGGGSERRPVQGIQWQRTPIEPIQRHSFGAGGSYVHVHALAVASIGVERPREEYALLRAVRTRKPRDRRRLGLPVDDRRDRDPLSGLRRRPHGPTGRAGGHPSTHRAIIASRTASPVRRRRTVRRSLARPRDPVGAPRRRIGLRRPVANHDSVAVRLATRRPARAVVPPPTRDRVPRSPTRRPPAGHSS